MALHNSEIESCKKSVLDCLMEDNPSCAVCFDVLGTHGGPASLPCGHNGCLNCLQEVFSNSANPLCPLCRASFDAPLQLGLNLELRNALDKAAIASQAMRFAALGVQKNGSNPKMGQAFIEKFIMHEISPVDSSEADPWVAISKLNTVDSIDGIHPSMINNGYVCMNAGEYVIPSAPPEFMEASVDVNLVKDVLDALPPQWVPDSSSPDCMQCRTKFSPITRSRHHCRFCGGLFCNSCSKARVLLPVSFFNNNPQRVCDTCHDRLKPVQCILAQRVSNASQVAIRDMTDYISFRSWINNPLGFTMEDEIFKATNTLRSVIKITKPSNANFLKGAEGLVIVTAAKAGVYSSFKFGTGLVLHRKCDDSWSGPSSICTLGLGFGPQVGGQIDDFIIVLRSVEQVKAFSGLRYSIRVGMGISAGLVGAYAETDFFGSEHFTSRGWSKGAYVGTSLESTVFFTRISVNSKFYGDPYLKAKDILLGDAIPPPTAAQPLYAALFDLFSIVEANTDASPQSLPE